MAHDKVHVICENLCLEEGMTKEQIEEAINAEEVARKAEVAVERARINNIASLPEGSTSGDAELIDGRVSFDGSTYSNIGSAIRGQAKNNFDLIKNINDKLNNVILNSSIEWESGSIGNTGYKNTNNKLIRFKDFIYCEKGSVIKLSNYTPYVFKVFVYSQPTHSSDYLIYHTDSYVGTPVVLPVSGYIKAVIGGSTVEITNIPSVSQYFNGYLFNYEKYFTEDESILTNNRIDTNSTEIKSLANTSMEIIDETSLVFESGVIFDNGFTAADPKSIRTTEFLKIEKNSVVSLKDYNDKQIRVLVYSTQSYSTPLETSGWKQEPYVVQNSGYLKIVINKISSNMTEQDMFDYPQLLNCMLIGSFKDTNYKLPDDWKNKITEFKKLQGNKIAVAIQTDTHYSIIRNDNINIANNLKTFTNYFGLDFIANLGDIIQGYETNTLEDMKNSFTEIMNRYVDNCRTQFLYTVGNHEDCYLISWYGSKTLDECILKGEIYANTIPFVNNTGKITKSKELYYYKDFDDYRVIVLCTRDIPFQALGANDISINNHAISQAQVDWFENTALNTNKPVLVMSHVPLNSQLLLDTNVVKNSDKIITAMEQFKTNGGIIIASLCGHTHQQTSVKENGINYICFKNGGLLAELLFIDLDARTITTKLIGTHDSSINDRNFTF